MSRNISSEMSFAIPQLGFISHYKIKKKLFTEIPTPLSVNGNDFNK